MTEAWLDAVLAQRGSRSPPYRPESKQAVKRHLADLVQVRTTNESHFDGEEAATVALFFFFFFSLSSSSSTSLSHLDQ